MRTRKVLLVGALVLGVALLVGLALRVFVSSEGDPTVPGERESHDPAFGPGEGFPADPRLEGSSGADVREEEEPPARGEVRVRVVDASGVAVPGASVIVFYGTRRAAYATDREGTVVVEGALPDEAAFVGLRGQDATLGTMKRLAGKEVVLRATNVIALRVHLHDAETGAELGHAEWRLDGDVHRLRSGDEARIALPADRRFGRPYKTEAPGGFVDWEQLPWSTVVSRYATRLVARHPLRREADVTVVVVDEEDADIHEAQVSAFRIAEESSLSPQTDPWMLGGIPLKGVPFLPGQELVVQAGVPDGRIGLGRVVLPKHSHEAVEVKIVVKAPTGTKDDSIGLKTDNDLPYEESLGSMDGGAKEKEPLTGVLDVLVLRADGSPAIGAEVGIRGFGRVRTDTNGHARVEHAPEGERVVTLREPGLVPIADRAGVVAGGTVRLTLLEPHGGALAVTVKTQGGRALPFARIYVATPSRVPWVDLDPSGEQRIDPYVGADGTRKLHRLEPGEAVVHASWGGLSGRAEITVRDQRTESVTVLVR